jgi:hypothetical protein
VRKKCRESKRLLVRQEDVVGVGEDVEAAEAGEEAADDRGRQARAAKGAVTPRLQ